MICFIYKWLLSNSVTEDKEPSARLSGHLGKCPGCLRFYTEHANLAHNLRTQAGNNLNLSGNDEQICGKTSHSIWKRPAMIAALLTFAIGAIFAYVQMSSPSQIQLDCLDDNAYLVINAPSAQYAAISSSPGFGDFTQQYNALESFTKETFKFVYSSFTAATDAPGLKTQSD
jgi:hypothetical protein